MTDDPALIQRVARCLYVLDGSLNYTPEEAPRAREAYNARAQTVIARVREYDAEQAARSTT